MIKVQLPCLHIVDASGNGKEIIILPLNQLRAVLQHSVHDILMLLIGNILVTIAAEHVIQLQSSVLSHSQSLPYPLHLPVMISPWPAAARKRPIPGK